jgi:hypothetical protein
MLFPPRPTGAGLGPQNDMLGIARRVPVPRIWPFLVQAGTPTRLRARCYGRGSAHRTAGDDDATRVADRHLREAVLPIKHIPTHRHEKPRLDRAEFDNVADHR